MNFSAIQPEPRIPQRMAGASLAGLIREGGNDLGNDIGYILRVQAVEVFNLCESGRCASSQISGAALTYSLFWASHCRTIWHGKFRG